METILSDDTVSMVAHHVVAGFLRGELSFTSRANRDRVAQCIAAEGVKVRKSSTRNQSIDPRYTVEGRHLPDLGMANDRVFTNLYHLRMA